MTNAWISRAAIALLVAVAAVGCGSKEAATSVNLERSRLKGVISLYNYASRTLGHAPKSEEEFKSFIAQNGGAILESQKVASADELLTSERDGQPYVVVYGQRPAGMEKDVVAYEQTGADGQRLVAFGLGSITVADETKFRELIPAGAEAAAK